MAGVGKTRFAVHAAHAFARADRFDQVQPSADPAGVLEDFLRLLGVPGTAIPRAIEERAALYRGRLAGRRGLILLDNVATEEQVAPLLPGDPGILVLITTRHRLSRLAGVARLPLEVFSPDEAVALLARIAGAERIRADPQNYHLSLGTTESLDGEVGGRLAAAGKIDPGSVIRPLRLVAEANGARAAGPGDPDATATVWLKPWGSCLDYTMRWSELSPPTAARVFRTSTGSDDEPVGRLFESPVPANLTGLAGRAEGQDKAATDRINAAPRNYFVGITSAEFPREAVRGRLKSADDD